VGPSLGHTYFHLLSLVCGELDVVIPAVEQSTSTGSLIDLMLGSITSLGLVSSASNP